MGGKTITNFSLQDIFKSGIKISSFNHCRLFRDNTGAVRVD